SYRTVTLVVLCALGCGRGTLDLRPGSDPVEPEGSTPAGSTGPVPEDGEQDDDPGDGDRDDDRDDNRPSDDPVSSPLDPDAPAAPTETGEPCDPHDGVLAGPTAPPMPGTGYPPAPSASTPLQRCFEPADCDAARPYCTRAGFCGECIDDGH